MAIIEVNHLTKEYQLGHLTSLKETALNTMRRLAFQPVQERERFKALDDVNFHINEGEVVGIIGHNGAGKSTLLKHLANISKPTKGEVIVKGSVAPLIEVGAGVNPELTGRENIYLNGAILGIPKKIIQQKLDEIIDFSELEQFIDTPVKRYSSGMTVKLGFSIATSMEADILIVDEVLSVGDLAFQRKCFDRMENLIKHNKKTVLIVSHNIRQIERLCTRAILFDHGKIQSDDTPETVCDLYYSQSDTKINKQIKESRQLSKNNQIGSGEFELIRMHLTTQDEQEVSSIIHKGNIDVVIEFFLTSPLEHITFGLGVHTTDFLYLTTHNSENEIPEMALAAGKHQIKCTLKHIPLLPGIYSLRLGVTASKVTRTIFYSENILTFQVMPELGKSQTTTMRDGFFALDAQWIPVN
ncbi:ABC transporter ATP-binding protein [Methylomonas sp. TEB]|uniref:ABC transporter ATP-binding protein n=1 Tax=Methylomonas sp. TEB TaxID=3398229 RepID=UPI0039F5EE94